MYLVSMSPNCVHQSDHPILNSRYLVYEAQQAYFYGLPKNLALASVTSTPADIMGLGHRIGFVKAGKFVVTISASPKIDSPLFQAGTQVVFLRYLLDD